MTIGLAHYLKDFSEPQPVEPPFADDLPGDDMFALPMLEPEPIDIETVRSEAYAEGREAAILELEERFAGEREAIEAAHREEIELLRQAHESQSAAAIAATVGEMANAIANHVGDQTAAVLAPIMTEMLAEKAVDDMARLIYGSILDGSAATITVKGPENLFEILKTTLGDHAGLLRHVETPDLDLTVEMGSTVLVTRLSAWAASLKKVLE